jgi:hypothetical protein
MEFPQFRKLENGRSLYKITSPNQFTELQQIGSKWFSYAFEVQQFPDLLRIQDMLQGNASFVVIRIPSHFCSTLNNSIEQIVNSP